MIALLRRVGGLSIINYRRMKASTFRDEMDIPSGILYGFSKLKEGQQTHKTTQKMTEG